MTHTLRMTFMMLLTACFLLPGSGSAQSFTHTIKARNDAHRILTGEQPEFAFWFPNRAGNLKFGIVLGNQSLWLNDAKNITFRQDGTSCSWTVQDDILKGGTVQITAVSLSGADGIILKVACSNTPPETELFWYYAGAADTPFDASDAPLKPAHCFENKNTWEPFEFTLYYGQSMALRVVIGIYPRQSQVRDVNPHMMESPLTLYASGLHSTDQAIAAKIPNASAQPWYFTITAQNIPYYDTDLPKLFTQELK